MSHIFISAAITIISFVLLIISLHSYNSFKNKKLLLITVVFIFFLIRGIILSLGLFYPSEFGFSTSFYMWSFDVVILAILYLSSLKR